MLWKLFLIKKAVKIVTKVGLELLDDGKISKEDAKKIVTEEVTGILQVLPNVVTDEARRREQSRRSREGGR